MSADKQVNDINWPLYYEHVKEGYRSRQIRHWHHSRAYNTTKAVLNYVQPRLASAVAWTRATAFCARYGHYYELLDPLDMKQCLSCGKLGEQSHAVTIYQLNADTNIYVTGGRKLTCNRA